MDEAILRPGRRGPRTGRRSQFRRRLSSSRTVLRIAYRDPEHVAERLTLFAANRLSSDSRNWADKARQAETAGTAVGHHLISRSAHVARITGAISGTPFFLALIPGYLTYLWQEARMVFRAAALHGHDPGSLRRIAELLCLCDLHLTVEGAEMVLIALRDSPLPPRPVRRRSLSLWFVAVKRLLVLGSFMHPDSLKTPLTPHEWIARAVRRLGWAALLIATWLNPIAGVLVMALACEHHTRQLGHRALAFYAQGPDAGDVVARTPARREAFPPARRALLTVTSLATVGAVAFLATVGQSFSYLGWGTLAGGFGLTALVGITGALGRQ